MFILFPVIVKVPKVVGKLVMVYRRVDSDFFWLHRSTRFLHL